MKPSSRILIAFAALLAFSPTSLFAQETANPVTEEGGSVRFATFNMSLYDNRHGGIAEQLAGGEFEKAKKLAAIVQIVRPDVILINEFDYEESGAAVESFRNEYLGVAQGDNSPISYEHFAYFPVNTGVDSGLDLNGDGKLGLPNDCYGFGRQPGQYGMLVLSNYPIDESGTRTFQNFLWKDMPDHEWPVHPETGESYYSDAVREIFRLSSKSHWDLPVQIGERTVHFLVSHPTPPVFDKEEDHNGCRNHDEIRFWADYVRPDQSDYIYDDEGKRGGLAEDAHFVIAGDLNADPCDGDSRKNAATLLTEHELINNEFAPTSEGATQAAEESGRANESHSGDPACDTGDFHDKSIGNLRIDYVLPSRTLTIADSGVFWPASDEPNHDLVRATDHRLVWIDVEK